MFRYSLLLALLLFGSTAAAANWQLLADDSDPAALSGRAVLLLSVQTDRPLRGLRLDAVDGRGRIRLGPFHAGSNLQAIALQPGRYRLAAFALADSGEWFDTSGSAAVAFGVTANTLSTAGELVLTEVPGTDRMLHRLVNRSAHAWELLKLRQPKLLAQWPLRYAGDIPDPFPSLWATLAPGDDATVELPPRRVDTAEAPAKNFFRPRAIGDIGLSPDGKLLAMSYAESGPLRLWLIDLHSRQRFELRGRLRSDSKLQWCGKRCLAITSGQPGSVEIRRLRTTDQGWTSSSVRVPVPGYVIDPLPQRERQLLFGRVDNPTGNDAVEVYRLDLRGDRIEPKQLARGRRLDRGVSGDFGWVGDSTGELRAALVRKGGRYLLQSRDAQDRWRTLVVSTPESQYDPLAMDGSDGLYALSEHVGNVRALVRTDLATGDSQTLYTQPGADLVGVVLSQENRQPLAVRYFVDNRLRSHGLSAPIDERITALQSLHPDASLALTQVAADGQRWLYFTDSSSAGEQWWVQDAPGSTPQLIAAYRPWLQAEARSSARSLRLQTVEGWPLEAVVVEPPSSDGPLPVVVLAHGGPIGVRDSLMFDSQAQYLASQGLAVLMVNYRGSTGYGKDFRRAAYGAAGQWIENDIAVALAALLADPRYDSQRVCAMGSSYGGYSALMLAVRQPALIRCVVALAPITDIPLRFSSSDWNTDPLQSTFQHRLYGDPLERWQQQRAQSPVYQHHQLRARVLLGHGLLDQRVDPEHSRRLALVLARAGRPTPVLWYANEAHGLSRADNLTDWMQHAAGFIHQQLDALAPALVTP